jgi:hypothetical protein
MAAKKSTDASKSKLKPETRRVLVEAFDKAFRSLGFPALEEACETFNQVLKGDLSEADRETVFRSTTMMGLLDYIDNRSEPTPKELEEILAKLQTLPFEFRAHLDQTMKSVKRKLPHKPGGGRPHSLDPDQKREACRRVGILMAQGVTFRDALDRVAKAFGVGARTIQRAWQKRRELHKT